MGKGYFYYEKENHEVNKFFKKYFELDKNSPIEMGKLIHELCGYKDETQTKIHTAISKDLIGSGYLSSVEYDKESSYMEKYNNIEQFFKLDEDINELSNCLISRYIGSVKLFGKPNDYVEYLSNIFCDRFIKHRDVDKIELLKRGKTYTEYIKK
jgi:hypothetical protein